MGGELEEEGEGKVMAEEEEEEEGLIDWLYSV